KEFYYGKLDDTENKISDDEAERVEFLQEISVEVPQEIEKAYGDNTVAEIAVSTDSVTLSTTFHTIPIEDRAAIYGWGGDEEGEFMPREIDGIDKRTPFIIKKDKPGETKNRDRMYEQLFGVPHPDKSGNDDNGDEGEETP